MTHAARLGADAAARLKALGKVSIEAGLTDAEFEHIEQLLGFEFSDDHRAFLAAGLPVGASWPNWRSEGRKSLQKRLQLPLDGILFAVEWNDFWADGWGARPARMKDALRSANYYLARVPRLVPVYSHRYLPAGRGSFGHPVLSVIQTEVTACGAHLADYIDLEFGSEAADLAPARPTVEFWSDLIA
ncbi:hypothetical protein [Mycolicibacterium mengxianglii]|uniref:hypothetical protein n=1 Tax=Mycolicibacterium mengxianglii TaxID=2736649 RepID=UPI0018D0743E|nr:hypothetical protein [Mycolicibacterium mengxianglii]